MKRLTLAKTNFRNASIFVLGVIVTIIITKASDKVVPNEPVIVKQIADTVRIVHDYNIPENLNNDTIRQEIENKVKNLELLNNYDKQINERLSSIQKSDRISPNLIVTPKLKDFARKGYMYGSSSSYFLSDCPDLTKKFIDLKIDFLNPAITKDIACLRVNIYRFDSGSKNEAREFVLEDLYEVKNDGNIIRISNDFASGKYEIIYGFMFKSDSQQQFPTFYFKRCVVSKT
jgi:hypothetical protein